MPESTTISNVVTPSNPRLTFQTRCWCAAAVVLAAPMNAPVTAQMTCPLYPAPVTNVGTSTYTLAAGDLTSDGSADVVVGLPGAVRVFQNDGFGAFAPGPTYAVPANPKALAIADFNGDGLNDVLAASTESNSVSVLRNLGGGLLASAATAWCGQTPVAFSIGDLDGDGDLDVVVVNSLLAGTLSVMTNNGTGGLVKTATLSIGRYPISVAIGRFNADEAPDLAVTYQTPSGNAGLLAVLYNIGGGVFGPPINVFEPTNMLHSVHAADLNGDGNTDIAVVASFTPAYRLMGDGFGGFKIFGMPYFGMGTPTSILEDVNNDGRADLFTIQASTGAPPQPVIRLSTQADGSFAAPEYVWACHTPQSIVAADMDTDGFVDLVVGNNGAFTVLRNDGFGDITGERLVAESALASRILPVDIDDDGDLDLVTGGGSFASHFSVRKNNGDLTYASPINYTYDNVPSSMGDIVLADIDGDGDSDAVVYASNDLLHILKNNGSFVFGSSTSYNTGGGGGSQIAAVDLDGDNDIDVAVPSPNSQGSGTKIHVLKNSGNGTFGSPISFNVPTTPYAVTAADMDGDADYDLLVASAGYYNGIASVSFLRNEGNAIFAAAVVYPLGIRPAAVKVGDLDEDGDLDVIVSSFQNLGGGISNDVLVMTNDGTGQLGSPVHYVTGPNPGSIVVQDINGDGRLDIVTRAYSTEGIYVLVNAGGAAFNVTRYGSIGAPMGIAVSDFTADDLPDIIVSHQTGSFPLALLSHQGYFANIVQQPSDMTVVAGENAHLEVVVEPSGTYSYQWFRNDVALVDKGNISGATTSQLTIAPASSTDSGNYRVRIGGANCSIDSLSATLTVIATCMADIAPPPGDGVVNQIDLLEVINAWGPCNPPPSPCTADVTGDGQVNVSDLLAVINAWGPCP